VLSAHDAVHALSIARDQKPDAIVLSSRLAGGGIPALRRLRSNVFTAHIPVIAIAKKGAEAKQMIASGAQECVSSPADCDELQRAIRKNMLEELDFTQAPGEVLEDKARVADLHDTGLLDSPPEEAFDRVTRLASRLLGAPTALVSLIDTDRQFFKSQIGLAQPWAGERQTRLSHSFCQWVVSGGERLVVGNAREHPVLKSNLAIRDLGVIAYAGVPLAGRKGAAIGSFCAIDSKPRQWSAEELATLESLGRITQAYAVLGQARRAQSGRTSSAAANLQTSMLVAGGAILGAVQVLKQFEDRIGSTERADLLAIIEEQATHLAAANA